MRATRESQQRAFTEFATALTPRLFRKALLMCGDWHLAEDLVQTTLAKLYTHWSKVERSTIPEAYAQRTLTNAFLSHKRVRRNSELPVVDLGDHPPTAGSVGDRLELFEALRTLDALDRAIVVLRYWEDRSVAETATEVGLSDGAVRTRASRALGLLRTELSGPAAARVPGRLSKEGT